jgi:hypothetical protein
LTEVTVSEVILSADRQNDAIGMRRRKTERNVGKENEGGGEKGRLG